MKRVICAGLLALSGIASTTWFVAETAEAAPPVAVCRDSNGARPGGSVYVRDGRALGCDLVAGQRLHVTGVKSAAACDDMGGRWSRSRICWDVDY